MTNAQAPSITIDGVPLQRPEATGLRLLKHAARVLAEKLRDELPPGTGFALVLVDGGHEGFWSVQTGGQGDPVLGAAHWLQSRGLVVAEVAAANGAPAKGETRKADEPKASENDDD